MINRIDWQVLSDSQMGEPLATALARIAEEIVRKINELVDRVNELQPPYPPGRIDMNTEHLSKCCGAITVGIENARYCARCKEMVEYNGKPYIKPHTARTMPEQLSKCPTCDGTRKIWQDEQSYLAVNKRDFPCPTCTATNPMPEPTDVPVKTITRLMGIINKEVEEYDYLATEQEENILRAIESFLQYNIKQAELRGRIDERLSIARKNPVDGSFFKVHAEGNAEYIAELQQQLKELEVKND